MNYMCLYLWFNGYNVRSDFIFLFYLTYLVFVINKAAYLMHDNTMYKMSIFDYSKRLNIFYILIPKKNMKLGEYF